MSSASNSNFTRGAQLWAHNMRMVMQGAKNICLVGLAFVLVLTIIRLYQYLSLQTIYYFLIKCYAACKLSVGAFFYSKSQIVLDFYSINKGRFVRTGAEEFIYQFWYRTPYGPNINRFLLWLGQDALFEIAITFGQVAL